MTIDPALEWELDAVRHLEAIRQPLGSLQTAWDRSLHAFVNMACDVEVASEAGLEWLIETSPVDADLAMAVGRFIGAQLLALEAVASVLRIPKPPPERFHAATSDLDESTLAAAEALCYLQTRLPIR